MSLTQTPEIMADLGEPRRVPRPADFPLRVGRLAPSNPAEGEEAAPSGSSSALRYLPPLPPQVVARITLCTDLTRPWVQGERREDWASPRHADDHVWRKPALVAGLGRCYRSPAVGTANADLPAAGSGRAAPSALCEEGVPGAPPVEGGVAQGPSHPVEGGGSTSRTPTVAALGVHAGDVPPSGPFA